MGKDHYEDTHKKDCKEEHKKDCKEEHKKDCKEHKKDEKIKVKIKNIIVSVTGATGDGAITGLKRPSPLKQRP